jgi:hypothetical protein
MARRIPLLALLGFSLSMTAGCDKGDSGAGAKRSSQGSASSNSASRETSGGSYFVRYTADPNPIPLNEMFTLMIHVYQDADLQRRAEGVTVEVDAAMPAHHHGMNLSPRVQRMDDGSFRASGMLFHMPGYWEVYVDVSREGKKERARFELEIQ